MRYKSVCLIICLICVLTTINFSTAFATEPAFMGVFLGELPYDKSNLNWIGYPQNYGSSAGAVYLYNNNIDTITFVSGRKAYIIKEAKKEAVELAKQEGKTSYSITNLSFQVIRTENTTEVYSDFYIIAW